MGFNLPPHSPWAEQDGLEIVIFVLVEAKKLSVDSNLYFVGICNARSRCPRKEEVNIELWSFVQRLYTTCGYWKKVGVFITVMFEIKCRGVHPSFRKRHFV